MRTAIVLTAASVCLAPASSSAAALPSPCAGISSQRAWCDARLSVEARADALVAELTPSERVRFLAGEMVDTSGRAQIRSIPRLGIPPFRVVDGPVGVRLPATRATAMPSGLALAASFDRELAWRAGATIAREAHQTGHGAILGPTINVVRDPRGGRAFESFGEDPFLTAEIAVPWIQGAQAQGVSAMPKHLAGNEQEGLQNGAGSRIFQDSRIDERTLQELYLTPFEAAVREGRAGAVMCSYNRLNGQKACGNRSLLQGTLRGRWGFDGLVMSDWIFATWGMTPAQGLGAGLDVEMPLPQLYAPSVLRATGVQQTLIDARARAVARFLLRFGWLDAPPTGRTVPTAERAAHDAVAEEIEAQGAVLLTNDGVLPLDPRGASTIAVVGPVADRVPYGSGSSQVLATGASTLAEGVRAAMPSAKLRVAQTFDPLAAARAAAGADVAIVTVRDTAAEGVDRRCLALAARCAGPYGEQDALVRAVSSAARRTVVISFTSGAVLMPWRERVNAIVQGWYGGQAVGRAIAAVLTGAREPSGRLPITFPAAEGQTATAGSQAQYPGTRSGRVDYSEGQFTGYRWHAATGEQPAFAFGHGLAYTTFALSDLAVPAGARDHVEVTVRNTGVRPGTAVPQLYADLPASAEGPTPRKLIGFTRVRLAPGASRRVTIAVPPRALQAWSVDAHDWRPLVGCARMLAGQASDDLPLQAQSAIGGGRCP